MNTRVSLFLMPLKATCFLLSGLGFLLVAGCVQPQAGRPAVVDLEQTLDTRIQADLDSGRIAGLVIGIAQGDSLLLLKGYGQSDLEWSVPMPVDASFEIGSVTKQFTAVAILQLAEAGKLSLDDPITDYLEFDTRGYTVSVGHLLDHTSGIKSYTELPGFFGQLSLLDRPRDTMRQFVEAAGFDFAPGEAMIYNNSAYFLLGLIIEKVSGQSYESYVAEHLFAPAGMTRSYYCDEQALRAQRAHGYDLTAEGLVRKGYIDHQWPYAAGSLCSTVEDLLAWMQVLHHTDKLLSPESYRQLITPGTLLDGTSLRYAKGLAVYPDRGQVMIQHGGGIHGFVSDTRYFPEADLRIVTLINTSDAYSAGEISNLAAEQLLAFGERATFDFEGDLSPYTGTYSGRGRGRKLTVHLTADGGHLILQLDGRDQRDTLMYAGDQYWRLDDNTFYFSPEGEAVRRLAVNDIYGCYVLEKTGN